MWRDRRMWEDVKSEGREIFASFVASLCAFILVLFRDNLQGSVGWLFAGLQQLLNMTLVIHNISPSTLSARFLYSPYYFFQRSVLVSPISHEKILPLVKFTVDGLVPRNYGFSSVCFSLDGHSWVHVDAPE